MNIRRTRRLKKGQIRCRCQTQQGKLCWNPAKQPSLFCALHQNCGLSPLSGSEPVYDPARYDSDPKVQKTHNCFAYGMNVLDPKQLTQCDGKQDCKPLYHQPGGTKNMAKTLNNAAARTCKVVEQLMQMDVPMKRTTFRARCPAKTSKIALVVHPTEDYHFVRQDSDGGWSHKDGSNPVKRFDAEGQDIVDPMTAVRDYRPRSFLNYSDFCGYYCAPRDHQINLARTES